MPESGYYPRSVYLSDGTVVTTWQQAFSEGNRIVARRQATVRVGFKK